MTKPFVDCLPIIKREVERLLGVPFNVEKFAKDATISRRTSIRVEMWQAWGYSVTVELKFESYDAMSSLPRRSIVVIHRQVRLDGARGDQTVRACRRVRRAVRVHFVQHHV
jgi:hypothetical protein